MTQRPISFRWKDEGDRYLGRTTLSVSLGVVKVDEFSYSHSIEAFDDVMWSTKLPLWVKDYLKLSQQRFIIFVVSEAHCMSLSLCNEKPHQLQ